MAFSAGSKGLVQQAASWITMVAITAFSITHFDEIRSTLGLKLEPEDFGVTEAVAVPAGASHRESAAQQVSSSGAVTIRAGSNGHYETRAQINGRSIDVLVDTGATTVALTYEDAASAGIFVGDADFRHRVSTANGTARVAAVVLDSVAIDGITVRNVRAVVAEPGRLGTTLLGMSFLGQLRRAEMSRGVLTLEQ